MSRVPVSDSLLQTLRLLPLEKSAFAQALAWRAAEYESPGKELPGVEWFGLDVVSV